MSEDEKMNENLSSTEESVKSRGSNDEESPRDFSESRNSQTSNLKWYSIYVQSGCEQKALEALQHRIKMSPYRNLFGEILIPKLSESDESSKARKLMPGYIFIQMEMNDETWEIVRKTPKVLGFIGGFKNPPPIPDEEINHIKEIIQSKGETLKKRLEFNEGDAVAIIDGPFKDFFGKIVRIDQESMKLTVEISIFGRQTPVQVDYSQVTRK